MMQFTAQVELLHKMHLSDPSETDLDSEVSVEKKFETNQPTSTRIDKWENSTGHINTGETSSSSDLRQAGNTPLGQTKG
ncbi:hypothetical protein NPIL_282971 [Nephila pilipes]|uniref:Uncharacterized protein n=1 Tax=Nephila pilipes TaxID=299642 RepID=A0A8X6NQS3_NEPPI|nr:hypothetical protein NPIL_282971 [Nephila pilipes]